MKKIIIISALAFIGSFSYGQSDTTSTAYTKFVVGKDTAIKVVFTIKATDTINKKQARLELQQVNERIKTNNESKVLQIDATQAEWKRIDAILQDRKNKLKAILAK